MPFVADSRKPRSHRLKSTTKLPSKLSRLSIRSRASDVIKYPSLRRFKQSPSSMEDKRGENRLHGTISRIRRSLFPDRVKEHPVHRFTSPPRPGPNNQIQKKTVLVTRTVGRTGMAQRTYTICAECYRRCAFLEVILEEDAEDESLANPVEQKTPCKVFSCSRDLAARRPREPQRFHGQTLSA